VRSQQPIADLASNAPKVAELLGRPLPLSQPANVASHGLAVP
jgi:hypothetical protein